MLRYAAIDIGSNAVRMLFQQIYENENGTIFKKMSLVRLPIRLGDDAFLKGEITKPKEDKLLHMANAFVHLCSIFEVENYLASATSAMRDSKNGGRIIERISKETGVNINIIPGDVEAEVLYESIFNTGKIDENKTYMLIDVGGGSTEINIFAKGERKAWKSFNIGTIRLKEGIQDEKEWEVFSKWLKENAALYQPEYMVGTGGNINKIYKLCGLMDWQMLRQSDIEEKIEFLKQFTPTELVNQFDIRDDRADVIVHGASIYNRAMIEANIEEMIVPKVGLADGLIRRAYFSKKANQN